MNRPKSWDDSCPNSELRTTNSELRTYFFLLAWIRKNANPAKNDTPIRW